MSHSNTFQAFTYTKQRGPYLSVVGTFLFLSLVESLPIAFLVPRFVPNVFLHLLIQAAHSLLLLGFFGKLLFPLWTHHRLSATRLDLRYGLDFHARLPLDLLVAVQPVQEKVGPVPVVRYNAVRKRLSLAFSEQGQILLCLKHPVPFRLGLRRACVADQLLINLDQRDAFLADLNLARQALSAEAATVG